MPITPTVRPSAAGVSVLFIFLESMMIAYQFYVFYFNGMRPRSVLPVVLLLLTIIFDVVFFGVFSLNAVVAANVVSLIATVALMFPGLVRPDGAGAPGGSAPDVEREENASGEGPLCPVDVFLENCQRYGLSAREVEVVLLVRKGYRYKEIAAELFISEKTVESHVQNIFQKVGERNKTAMLHKLNP